jgi:hypothetical protein
MGGQECGVLNPKEKTLISQAWKRRIILKVILNKEGKAIEKAIPCSRPWRPV